MAVLGIKKVTIKPEQLSEGRRGVKRYAFDAIPVYDPDHDGLRPEVLQVKGEKDCRNALQRMRAYNREHPEFEVRPVTRTHDENDNLSYIEFARQRAPWRGYSATFRGKRGRGK
jgi:hypothetical protein